MRYPTLAKWIRFKRLSENEYAIIDLLFDQEMRTDAHTAWFIRKLNGKRNPYEIDRSLSREAVDCLLDELDSEAIIRDKRFLSKSFLSLFVTVWSPRVTPKLRLVSWVLNLLLLVSWLPLLILSVTVFLDYSSGLCDSYIMTGCLAGLLIGVVLHEFGHLIACLGYGGMVFEAGLFWHNLLPGAYVLTNTNHIKHRMRRIQINAAGIEMNFLLTGISLFLSSQIEVFSGFFLGVAVQNVFLAFLNLMFFNGSDGMGIMGELFGITDIIEWSKKVTKRTHIKKMIRKDGLLGTVTIGIGCVFRAIQIALPILFAINILEVISWFQ